MWCFFGTSCYFCIHCDSRNLGLLAHQHIELFLDPSLCLFVFQNKQTNKIHFTFLPSCFHVALYSTLVAPDRHLIISYCKLSPPFKLWSTCSQFNLIGETKLLSNASLFIARDPKRFVLEQSNSYRGSTQIYQNWIETSDLRRKKGGTVNCAHSKDLGQINVLVGRSQPSTSWT